MNAFSSTRSIFSAAALGLICSVFTQHSSAAWEPTFVDNFSGNSIKANVWRPGWSHIARRINFYDKDAIRVQNGVLHLDVLNRAEGDRGYTTGLVTTQGIFAQQYGYFEMRARVPSGNGYWPAFWLMPKSGKWSSEIDIAEFRGQTPRSYIGAYHYLAKQRNHNTGNIIAGVDITKTFNNYALRWTPNRLEYLFNGQVKHVVQGDSVKYANQEMFLMLNMALTSQHVGWIPTVDRFTNMSQSFEIDYVRVYRQTNSGRYSSIPGPNANVPDLIPNAYDQTAMSVNAVSAGQGDFLRSPERLRGKFELTSHRNNYAAKVMVYLTRRSGFDDRGYYKTSGALEGREYWVRLARPGDKTVIDYSFDHGVASAGQYAVNVLVKEPRTGDKYLFDGARIVQIVNNSRADAGAHMAGFIRDVSSTRQNNRVSGEVDFQLQQAVLVPFLKIKTELRNADASRVLASTTKNYEHSGLGQLKIPFSINGSLANNQSYTLLTRVMDARGRVFNEVISRVGGGLLSVPAAADAGNSGASAAQTTTTTTTSSNTSTSTTTTGATSTSSTSSSKSTAITDLGSVGSNRLRGVVVSGRTATLNTTLNNINSNDRLFYTMKVLSPSSGAQIGKFTGDAGRGFNAGNVNLRVDLGSVAAAGQYRIVVQIFKNNWGQKIMAAATTVTVTR